MKTIPHITALMMLFTFHQSASAYSPIWNVEGWDAAQYKNTGITVTTRKHDYVAEVEPEKESSLKWIEITYDSSKLAEDQEVVMLLYLVTDDHKTISVQSVERNKGDPRKMKFHFVVSKECVKNSYVQMIAPKLLSEGAKRKYGNPGFGGVTIGLSRILQLAAEDEVLQKKDTGKDPAGKFVPNDQDGDSETGNAIRDPFAN